jgi:hypothetical protein
MLSPQHSPQVVQMPSLSDEQPVAQPRSTAGFLLICALVALTFGFGGYFLAATLR